MKTELSHETMQLIDEVVSDKEARNWLHNQELCMEVCMGSIESDCCGARIEHHDICSDCGEHCSNSCTDCELKTKCPNYNEIWNL